MHGERLENIALLRHPANAGGGTQVRGQGVQRYAPGAVTESDAARVLTGGASNGVEQGGFAGAIAP